MAIERQKPDVGLTVWQPFKELDEMSRQLDNYFGRPFVPSRRLSTEAMAWSPALDVVEKEDKFIVKVELPGVKDEDVDVSIDGNILTISGEKRAESEAKKKGYHYTESSYGSFSRSVTIPSNVDTSKVEANCDKGVLEITLPKATEVKTKKIKVASKKKEEVTNKK